MACGKMVLCDKLDKSKKLDELFEDGEDIVYYNDMVDCINKMNKYFHLMIKKEKESHKTDTESFFRKPYSETKSRFHNRKI